MIRFAATLLALASFAAPAMAADVPPAPAAAAAAPSAAPVVAADEAPVPALHHWELDLFGGYGQLAWPGLDAGQRWWNGGPAFAVTAAYRSPHFTHPFLDVAYVPFASSGRDVYVAQTNGSIYTTASTNAWAVNFGPGFDIAWLRLRAGVGLTFVSTSTTVQGTTSSTSSPHLGFLLSAATLVWERDAFAVGLEARLNALQSPGQGIYQTAWSAGLTGRWDFANH